MVKNVIPVERMRQPGSEIRVHGHKAPALKTTRLGLSVDRDTHLHDVQSIRYSTQNRGARAADSAQRFTFSRLFRPAEAGTSGGICLPAFAICRAVEALHLNVHHSVVRLRFCGFYRIRANRENLMRPQPLSCPDIHELGHKGNDCLGATKRSRGNVILNAANTKARPAQTAVRFGPLTTIGAFAA
jgi:hypothetical protein